MLIETERMIVRDFTMDDVQDLQEIFGDAETMRNCEPAYDLAKTEQFLRDFCIDKRGGLAAVRKESMKVIGYILFKECEPFVYEIGWIFNRNYWRKGYAYESCSAVMEYGFSARNARKIFAEAIDGVKSVGLMQKLGMRLEGVQREHTDDNFGHWADLYLYGILQSEWKARNKMDLWEELRAAALAVQNGRTISPFIDAGGVAAALRTKAGNIYAGVCIDTAASLGMCAERSAIANMITHGESQIDRILAIMPDGTVGPPCCACREFMMQLDRDSGEIKVLLDYETRRTVRLRALVPDWWGTARFTEE